MRAEQPCASCGTLISQQVADELHCPACGAAIDTVRPLNPYESPQAEPHSEEVPSDDPDSPRSRALQRMRIPVLGCRVILVVALLGGIVGTAGIFSHGVVRGWTQIAANPDFVSIISVPFWTMLAAVGLYGLRRAAKLDHPVWAWTGVVISGAVGIAFWIVLPFVIWAAVVLCSRDAREGFRSARRPPE